MRALPVKPTVIVSAAVAQRPFVGGHTWAVLQYLLGFRALGFEVVLIDRLEPEMGRDAGGEPCPVERSVNVAYLAEVMRRFDLEGAWAVMVPGRETLGLSRRELERRARSAALQNRYLFARSARRPCPASQQRKRAPWGPDTVLLTGGTTGLPGVLVFTHVA